MDKRVLNNFSDGLNTQVNDLFEKLGRYTRKIEVITSAANKSYTNIKKESLICWKKLGKVVKKIAKI